MSNVFVSDHPLVAHKLTKLRDVNTSPKKFRELVREISALMTYEATSDLIRSHPLEVTTPMGDTTGSELTDKIGLVPILRAGAGDGGRCVGIDAQCRGLAHRPVPG